MFCDSYDAVTVALDSDVLASMLTAYTYGKNRNIDIKRGLMVGMTALIGTVIGSDCGYLFNQAEPNGLGYCVLIMLIWCFQIGNIEKGRICVLVQGVQILPLFFLHTGKIDFL